MERPTPVKKNLNPNLLDLNNRFELAKKLLASIRIPEAPPEGFNALKAAPEELKRYGFPRRPDKTRNPGGAARWERAMSRPIKFVKPTFTIMEEGHIPSRPSRTMADDASSETSSSTSSSSSAAVAYSDAGSQTSVTTSPKKDLWSGAVVKKSRSSSTYTDVYAEWIVPHVYPSDSANGPYATSIWTGLDGSGTSTDILAVGTGHKVTVTNQSLGMVYNYAWFGWAPGSPIKAEGITIDPGDTVQVSISVDSSATVNILNYNNNQGFTISFKPPTSDTTLTGNCAEWVVSCMLDSGQNKIPMAWYGSTYFGGCSAWDDNSSDGDDDLNGATVQSTTGDFTSDASIECGSVLRMVCY